MFVIDKNHDTSLQKYFRFEIVLNYKNPIDCFLTKIMFWYHLNDSDL